MVTLILDVPKEISNPEILNDYLPFAKATICKPGSLVAVARVRSNPIVIPTAERYTFFEEYGENTQLKITFPAGVTKELQWLDVQVFLALHLRDLL